MKNNYLLIAVLMILVNYSSKSQTVSCNTSFLTSDWNCIGPFEYEKSNMGRVYAVWADPANTDHIYAGTGASGLWETTDGGANWSNVLSAQFPALGVWDIVGKQMGSENKWFLSTMFFSKLNIMNLGFIYYDTGDDTWKEVDEYPDYTDDKYDFKLGGPIKKLGFRQMFIRPGTDELWVANGQNFFKWDMLNEDWWYGTYYDPPVNLDDDGALNPKHTVNEIVFSPNDNTRAIVTSHNGIDGDVLFTENADDPNPSWYQIPTPYSGLFTLSTGDTYSMHSTACIPDNDKAYIFCEYLVYKFGSSAPPDKFCRIFEYILPASGGSSYPVLNRDIDVTYDPIGILHQLYVLNDGSNSFIIADNTNALYKSTIPISGSGSISLTPVSAQNFGLPWGNTHSDIRDTYILEDINGLIDKIYIATDGGVSMCHDFYNLTSGLNDDIWQNLNGYGLTITECNGFSNSEFEAHEILQSSPDGNNYVYNTKPGASHPEFQQIVYRDGYDGAITNEYDITGLTRKAIYNGNSKGARDPSNMYKIDLHNSELISLTPSSKPLPKSRQSVCTDCEVCPENCLQHNYAYKPANYEMDQDGSHFWTGTSDIFRVDDPHSTSSIWQPLSKTFATLEHLDLEVNDLANFDLKTYTPITAYKKTDNYPESGRTTIYYSTKNTKGGEVYTRDDITEYDNVKIVRAEFEDIPLTEIDFYSATDITPIIDEDAGSGTYNQINESFITDMVIDNKEPWQIWVSFGSNTLGGEGRILDECLGDNQNAKKGRVYYSTDAGATWLNRSAGLPNYPVLSLCYWEGSNDILFAGTEVGVYIWNVSENRWECFNENMPYCSISDLEINYCTMHLRAAVFGFGIWETPLPIGTHFSRPAVPAIEILGDVTWTQSTDIGRDIIVKPGGRLTIQNCEIRIPKEHTIIVERGAALILDGATLVNYCEPWIGIEIWGNTAKPHPLVTHVLNGTYPAASDDQGVVYLKNDSRIINAETAISTYKSTPEGDDATYRGGIIIGDSSSLINNHLALRFMPYDYPVAGVYDTDDDNISYFKNCTFSIDDAYLFDDISAYQIFLWDVDGVDFKGCDFTNSILQSDVTQRGEAIYSVDATYTVTKYCTDPYSPCEHYDNSHFSGFFRGIEAANTRYLPLDITITYNFFENNQRGVLLSNVANSTVLLNTYEIPDHATSSCYGLYLEDSEGYRVEENDFSSDTSFNHAAPYNAGIYVNNNSNVATRIYKNNFHYLETGIRSQSINKHLQLICNTFDEGGINY
ncbi:MAG: hypothetical protein IPG60_01085 [Bacteroidetes bacterium]|nr:hypothetical protein [Bacteroidota bacterium]